MGERGRRGTNQRYRTPGRRGSKGSPGLRHERDPHYVLAEKLTEALDPLRAPGKVRTLADMSEAERVRMLELYAPPKPKGGTP